MQGHWRGRQEGGDSCEIYLDIERNEDLWECAISIYSEITPQLQMNFEFFSTLDENNSAKFTSVVSGDDKNGVFRQYNVEIFLEYLIEIRYIDITWKIEISKDSIFYGSCKCKKNDRNINTIISGKNLTWESAKVKLFELENLGYIFRGQENSEWPLQTSYHRAGRVNLRKYERIDIQNLLRELSGKTQHFFDLTNKLENAAFYALLQHHGFPTPLLDWSDSPFVAAFFAFRKPVEYNQSRIYAFNARLWKKTLMQMETTYAIGRHLSLLKVLSIENPRIAPQQSTLMISNIIDIEEYILETEQKYGACFLQAIDIDGSSLKIIQKELSTMGITAAALFPGIEGVCEYQRYKLFEQ